MAHGSIPQFLGLLSSSYAYPPMARRAGSVTPLMFTNSSTRKTQSPMGVLGQAETRWQRELEEVRKKQKELADHQHRYAKWRVESGKQRADELQKFEADQENDEGVISEMEKDVAKRCQANTLNQENPKEVAAELQKMEERIDVERAALLERVKDFQEYLEKRTAEERDEVTQLNAEQNELEAREQQLLNTVKDDDEDENEQTRQNLSAQLRSSVQGQGSPTKSPVPTGPTNE